ncbi:Retrovirus-related Pol polyprotein from transposon TNT 1-94, partial [Lachnellula cervina]
ASYKSFKSADEYTSHIQSLAIYLKELGYKLPKPFIAILLFKGLSIKEDKYPELRTKLPRQNKKPRNNNNSTSKKTKSTKAVIITLASHGLVNQETSLVYNRLNNQESKFHKTQLILDSGANYKSISNKSIRIANGQSLAVLGKGNIPVKANNNKLIIKDVFYNITFKKDLVEIVKNTIRRYNAYYLNMLVDFNKLEPIVYYTKPEDNKLDLYYKRLNHLNKNILLKTINNTSGLSLGNNEASNNSISDCEPCFIGKFHNIGSKKPMSTALILSVYDIDIVGPIRPLGPKGEKYFITITDRGSRGAWVFPIKYKGDAYSVLVKFFNIIKTQFPKAHIKALKLDNIII